jgi:uncharacterized repeat protein (TIGR01451 family)
MAFTALYCAIQKNPGVVMSRLSRALLLVAFIPAFAFAQSADQEVVSVVDAPDPVTPGSTLTYTITLRNNGPDPAADGGFNTNLPGELTYVNTVAPAGFTCFTFGAAVSCTNPSFAPGTAVFTMTTTVGAHLANFPDGSFSATFSPSGVTADPNNGNNSKTAITTYNSPQIDLSLTVTDSPDPVFPDNNITYTIPVTNAGPDTATNVNFNVFNNGSLTFQSATIPAGWNCTLPAVNGNPTFTCTNPSFAPGNANFTVVLRASSAILGINDGTVSTAFGVNGTGNDTNTANNNETENTAYVTPDADMTVSVADSPDPVMPDNDITYTVVVANNGPDTAPNATLNVFNNATLSFQSATVPAGWSCTLPATNATPTFSCSNPSFASGASATFTIVVRADSSILGFNDGTVSTSFTAGSSVSDPNNTNNSETENTAYVTPDADLAVTASDSPDPVAAGSNITYSGNVTNNGPDAASSVTLSIPLSGSLLFQSITGPAGFSCATPAVGATGTITCTIASLANGASVPFTVVAQVDPSLNAGPDGIIQQTFTIGSATTDPDLPDNSMQVDTSYITPDADLSVTNVDSPDPVVSGGVITYTQIVTNNGPDTASDVVLTQTLPATLTFTSIAAPAGFACTTPAVGSSGTITCSTASMASGATGTFVLVTSVAAASGTVSLTVSVDGDTFDPDPLDNSATATTTVLAPEADLSITKTTNSIEAVQGGEITWSIAVTNSGPSASTNVVVTDVLPAGLTFVSATPTQGSCSGTTTVTCTLGTILNGASATITLVASVNASSGTITNSATVVSTEADPDTADRTATSSPLPVIASGEIPTLSQTMLLLMMAVLAAVATARMRT